ncbi:Crp/Fnr family transcriptional regulator [Clostridium uliginosum]|uniref:cAMP-binding domain of CRP or a regulatory subunit of cAMP-dependent protein kinases n=1 Tax=Clostridium uliginosum TaxID=119641 RepID=A0A1I1M3T9_9CLOT|nr:Crp/Fnr family transcriptional regulator [Clostridium uliginosum]SFC77868.1 cAMP-binding domain of CRP or a regulatory subunit of cAMP-dependent protein kinases [Clostridium uliginosum]
MFNHYKHSHKASMHIDSNLYEIFEKAGTIQRYKKNEIIYFQEDPAEKFYIIKSGRVRIFLVSKEGTELTIEILREGKLFGESSYFSYASRLTSVNAVTDVELVSVDLEQLLPYLTKYPNIMVQMFYFMSLTVHNLSIQVNSMAFLQADKKVAQLLLRLGANFKKNKNDTSYMIDYTHEEIAQLIGCCRVTVTKILNKFVKENWIALEYRNIIIINEEALKHFAFL